MKEPSIKNRLPKQQEGAESNTTASLVAVSESVAQQLYKQIKLRLLDVRHWHEYAGWASADFRICDSKGQPVDHTARIGNYIRIDLPAPGNSTGEGYDWVKVEDITEKDGPAGEELMMRVRPCSSPVNNDPSVAHFFTDDATSNFMVKREGKEVMAGVFGRNEIPNTSVANLAEKARNVTVGAAAIAGFSKIQWKSLVEGLLDVEGSKAGK
jgi:hypothetical protein